MPVVYVVDPASAAQDKGRKRHIAVDTLGLLLAVVVTAASIQDRDGAHRLLVALRARCSGVTAGNPRVPDLIGIVTHGVVYTGGKGKIAEHGGADPQDRNVPIVVSGANVENRGVVDPPVQTTQIAPTILRLLNLNPNALHAVQREHTSTLPLD